MLGRLLAHAVATMYARMLAQSPATISAVALECGTHVEAYFAIRRSTGWIVSTPWP